MIWPCIAAVVIEVALVPFSCLFASPNGSFGAPFPYIAPGPGWCTFGIERVDGPILLADLAATAAVFTVFGFALKRWRWLPLLTAAAAILVAFRFWPMSEGVLSRGISTQLWIAALTGYAVGALASTLLTRRIRAS